jgi:hypothetical protein
MSKTKPDREKDDDLEYIKAAWPYLTTWQKKCLLLRMYWFIIRRKITYIPIRWLEWQANR